MRNRFLSFSCLALAATASLPGLAGAETLQSALQHRPTGILPAQELRGGDFGAGNGGDGLTLSSAQAKGGDVTIPVPADLAETGILKVMGEPGLSQKEFVLNVFSCKTDAQGRLVKGGCDETKSLTQSARDQNLNKEIVLKPGTYAIAFGGMGTFAEVRAGQSTEIQMRKISVPASARPISFDVFYDGSDPDELLPLATLIFVNSYNSTYFKEVCSELNPLDKRVCQASADAKTPSDYIGTVVERSDNGSIRTWDFAKHEMIDDFHSVVDPKAGEFVSVFPGVYGIRFTDDETGDTRTQLGIRVE